MKFFRLLQFISSADQKKRLLDDDSLAVKLSTFNEDQEQHDSPAVELLSSDDDQESCAPAPAPGDVIYDDILPDELMVMILLYLEIQSLCKMKMVSNRFNKLCQDERLPNALFRRDFPSMWCAPKDIPATYIEFHKAIRDPLKIKQFPEAAQALLRMHGKDPATSVKPNGLKIETLLTKVGNRPLIRIFSRNQQQLDIIYGWLKLNTIDSMFGSSYPLQLSIICNQHNGFAIRFSKLVAIMKINDIEKLMYLAVLLGYGEIIRDLYSLRPDIKLDEVRHGLNYAEIATVEGNDQALDVLLSHGASFSKDSTYDMKLAIKRGDKHTLEVMNKHAHHCNILSLPL